MGYRVTVVNPTGFPLSGETDARGRVTYRPKIGGHRSTVLLPESEAEDLRSEHDRVVQARQKRALELRGGSTKKAAKKKAAKKKASAKKPRAEAAPKSKSQTAPTKTGDKKTYPIAIKGPKKGWPTVEGIAVGQHFGVHKGDDGQFSLTHLPSGRSLAASGTKKRLIEIGETLETHIAKAAGERFPKRVLAAIHKVPFLASWTRALTSGQTKLSYADFRQK